MSDRFYGDVVFPAWALELPSLRQRLNDQIGELYLVPPSADAEAWTLREGGELREVGLDALEGTLAGLVKVFDNAASYGQMLHVESYLEKARVPFAAFCNGTSYGNGYDDSRACVRWTEDEVLERHDGADRVPDLRELHAQLEAGEVAAAKDVLATYLAADELCRPGTLVARGDLELPLLRALACAMASDGLDDANAVRDRLGGDLAHLTAAELSGARRRVWRVALHHDNLDGLQWLESAGMPHAREELAFVLETLSPPPAPDSEIIGWWRARLAREAATATLVSAAAPLPA